MSTNLKLLSLKDFCRQFIYRVEEGDTLKTIAQKFNTTERVLIEINCLTCPVEEGEIILVEILEGEKYTVRPKDTILSIAGYDQSRAHFIKNKNKIDEVFVGQNIFI